MPASEWLPALTGFAGAAVGGLGAYASIRKSGPEAESVATTTLKSVIQELRAELDRKEVELNHMRVKLDKLDHHLTVLADLPPGHLG